MWPRLVELSDRIPLVRYEQIRYLVAGATAALANFAMLYALTEYAGIWYLFSSVFAVVVGFIVAFLLQKFWTFRNMHLSTVHVQFFLHILLSLANLALNTIALYVLVEYVRVWYLFGQVLCAVLLAVMNYFFYKRYIFPREIAEPGELTDANAK